VYVSFRHNVPWGFRICNAHYIKADWLEGVVWEKVKGVLGKPEVLLAETRQQIESDKEQLDNGALDQEIKLLNRKLKQYAGQERRLMDVLRMEVASPDAVLDTLNQMKKEKGADEVRLASLLQTRENIARMGDYEARLKELCARIAPDLNNCTNQDKKDAYTYLDLKIVATPEGVDIKGYLKPDLFQADSCVLTTGRTWA
jgi:site-specific DNA recombinase